MKVSFYESVAEHDLKFAVIISRYLKQWVFCKHKQRKIFIEGTARMLDISGNSALHDR